MGLPPSFFKDFHRFSLGFSDGVQVDFGRRPVFVTEDALDGPDIDFCVPGEGTPWRASGASPGESGKREERAGSPKRRHPILWVRARGFRLFGFGRSIL